MRRFKVLALFFIAAVNAKAQNPITLEECYERARQNYPLIKQKELIAQTKEYTIANAHSGYLPQFSINGQATYQSAVTRVPIDLPNLSIKPLAKDQYKIYGELNQTIFDGGTIKRTSALQEASAQVDDQRLEVELYKIKERINQIYFGVLLIDRQLTQIDLLRKDLQSSLTKTEAAIANGTAFKTNADILKAEILKADQRVIELSATRKAYLEMLGIFMNQTLNESVELLQPAVVVDEGKDISRPELTFYKYQRQLLMGQYQLNNTRNLPRLSFFAQGGYGRPGLNVLKNEFSTYYLGGFRLSWNLSGFYNTRRDKELLEVNSKLIDSQQELFLFNTKLALQQNSNEVNKLKDLIKVDDEIITLRTRIKETAKAQLENGVITANDFLRELNAEDQAKQNKLLHQVQWLLAQVNEKTTTGN